MKRIAVGVIHKSYARWPLGRFAPVRLGHHARRLHEADRSLTHERREGGGIEQNADQLFDVCLVSGLQQFHSFLSKQFGQQIAGRTLTSNRNNSIVIHGGGGFLY